MSFLFPGFFWAFCLLSIPIIVHLLNLRSYKTVYFSNVAFLSKLQKESKSRTQLQKWIILLIRLLALSSLILAFAHPVEKQGETFKASRQSKVIIYLDNSMSMTAGSDYGKNLDYAKKAAQKIVDSYSPSTQFYLITEELGKVSSFKTKADFLKELSSTEAFAKSATFKQVFKKINYLSDENSNQFFQIYLLSDFQKYTSDLSTIKNSKNYKIHILNFSSKNQENISIDSVWTENLTHLPLQNENLYVRLKNHGDKLAQNIHLKVFINDSLEAFSTLSINPKSFKTISLGYSNPENGAVYGKISINDYNILFDNLFYFSYFLKPKIKVAYYNPSIIEDFIPKFYSDTSFFNLKHYSASENISAINFSVYDLLVLDQIANINLKLQNKIVEILNQGTNVILVPAKNIKIGSFNSLFKSLNSSLILGVDTSSDAITGLDFEHPVFRSSINKKTNNIAFPDVSYHFLFSDDKPKDAPILMFTENTALKEISYKNAKLYAFAFPIDKKATNLAKNPIISPLFFNIAFLNGQTDYIYQRLQSNLSIKIPLNFNPVDDSPLIISRLHSGNGFIPQWQKAYDGKLYLNLHSQLKEVGLYKLKYKKSLIYPLAFNYVKRESETSYYSDDDLQTIFKEMNWPNFDIVSSEILQNKEANFKTAAQTKYWYYFVLLAFLFLLSETIILKFWKE